MGPRAARPNRKKGVKIRYLWFDKLTTNGEKGLFLENAHPVRPEPVEG
jgi:hypothetical protein